MKGGRNRQAGIERLDYRPVGTYRLDLEIFSVSELRQRVGRELQFTHRYAFYQLLYVTRGKCTHRVDFKPMRCEPGSLLVLRPGQAHNFGLTEDWDGWMVLFRPEFILSSSAVPDRQLAVDLNHLPEHLSLHGREMRLVADAIARMREDARIEAPPREVNALLRYQVYSLLLRLGILCDRQMARTGVDARATHRFRSFQELVEENFARWHQVGSYAQRLGCSEKSLTRATAEVMGMSAKAFIVSRIVLEAKRLLAHTSWSVSSIGASLGFGEATNFVKFFKREADCTPAQFRRRQDAVDAQMSLRGSNGSAVSRP